MEGVLFAGREAERFGAEQRHLMSQWQVIKISLSGYWRLPHCTGAHTLLLADRYTMERRELGEKKGLTLIFTSFFAPSTPLFPSLQLAHECSHLFDLISGKTSTVTWSTSAGFYSKLMKSHAYWNQLSRLPWWWWDHHKDGPLFQSETQSAVTSSGPEKQLLSLPAI